MKKALLVAALFATAPFAAVAGSLDTAADTQVPAPMPLAKSPALVFKLRAGVGAAPEYFGAKDLKAGPDFSFSLEYLRLPGGRSIGSADPNAQNYGFAPRGSFRYIAKRSAKDSPELAGLADVKASVEIGLGLGYTQRNFEAFADVRYGAIGHHAWVGEIGANAVMHPTEQLTLRVGPRVFFGDSDYANTYFGVAAATATLPAYTAKGGALSAGLELGATYKIDDNWGLDGALRWDKYLGDAKSSPIVLQGKDNNVSLRLGVTRRFSIGG
ncbi:MipA/OmpV family protein [Pseudorhodobacter sp. E13]|uniref:MipA/OmpV family protein n=1 Tax=Pseudorhodobacter sp. E13 TaxID=2487931 RepID=UPI000F8ED37C|nr:MipA/OmpV family protein [Pseudorhodobacter sp. E13]RUS63212.1 MipA/OmpV family protein [Pseudorhodobacter sp. E13]